MGVGVGVGVGVAIGVNDGVGDGVGVETGGGVVDDGGSGDCGVGVQAVRRSTSVKVSSSVSVFFMVVYLLTVFLLKLQLTFVVLIV